MNDIFNENVPLKTETPAFAKHVLPAVGISTTELATKHERKNLRKTKRGKII